VSRGGEIEHSFLLHKIASHNFHPNRQEFLGMQAKYNALENRSKDMLIAQGSAVSGANVALASLHTRIEHLVEQLISSYNISEQDLEVS
jgi:hypothetical protein